jgi:4'-phosphopantetheinyl transferase
MIGRNPVEPLNIWFRPTEAMDAGDFAQALATLPPEERARCDRFRFEHDRRDFAAAHALLRGALHLHFRLPPESWRFAADPAGKPFLVGEPRIEFNIAHTRGLVACALSQTEPIGVDVERIDGRRNDEALSQRYFAKKEIDALKSCADDIERHTRFTELWTLKEAYLKGVGSGLRRPLDEIAFEFVNGSKIQFSAATGSCRDWHFGLFARFRIAAWPWPPGAKPRRNSVYGGGPTNSSVRCRRYADRIDLQ